MHKLFFKKNPGLQAVQLVYSVQFKQDEWHT